ncbi:hypothetical protein Cpir12675_000811 [Ceratocystis pirilliformis]|uniref:Uncharacterized protein n=1 Tax=Ceratocystis pirilliformis TaxID=259994 RepID=A0ABR3ZKT8_9PEZI
MTPALALAVTAAFGVQAASSLPSAVHHIGIDITLIPDPTATSIPGKPLSDSHISITGPISLSAVDLGISGSRNAYHAAQLNVGDQGIVISFDDSHVGSAAPIRKTISPMLDGLCSASATNAAGNGGDDGPCAKKSSEIEIEAARAVLGAENHPVTVFTLRLSKLDDKQVEPPMYAQFAFDGAKSGSLIFLSDAPPTPKDEDEGSDEDNHNHEYDHNHDQSHGSHRHMHHHGHHHRPPPPGECDELRCRVADFFRAFSPFSAGGPPDTGYEAFDVDSPGPHMHHGPPGEPGIGMRPPGDFHHGHHHGHGAQPDNAGEDGPDDNDGDVPPPPPPPHHHGHHHGHHHHHHGHHHGHGPHPPFALFIINAFFSSIGFVFTMRLAANHFTSYMSKRKNTSTPVLDSNDNAQADHHAVLLSSPSHTAFKETSSLLRNAAPPPVYIEKENIDAKQ